MRVYTFEIYTMEEKVIFPAFRKYNNGLVYFKLTSETEFSEIKKMGGYYSMNVYVSENYQQRLFINDLLDYDLEHIERSDESEYEAIKSRWMAELKPVSI